MSKERKTYEDIFKEWLTDTNLVEDGEIELTQDFCIYLDNHFDKELSSLLEEISLSEEDKGKVHNMAACMLSILDYLKLQDKCEPGSKDMTELNDETLSEMMFRKMNGYGIDLNKELGFDHLKPVTKEEAPKPCGCDEQERCYGPYMRCMGCGKLHNI